MKFACFPGSAASLSGCQMGWCCKPLCLLLGFRGTALEKKSVLTFLHCLKWVFQPAFSSFSNAFQFLLMTLKWDKERVRPAIYPSWGSSGWGRVKYLNMMSTDRYMGWRGNLKQGSLDNTPSFRHCIYDILQNNVLCYIENSNMECGTCKFSLFQLNRPMWINWT